MGFWSNMSGDDKWALVLVFLFCSCEVSKSGFQACSRIECVKHHAAKECD